MVEVLAVPPDLLMLALQQLHRLAAAFAALLAAGHAPLRFGELLLSLAVVPGGFYRVTFRRDEEHLQSNVYTCLTTREWQRLGRHLRTGDAGVPTIGLSADRDGLGRTLQRAMHPDGNTANLRQTEHAAVQHQATAILGIGEAVVAIAPLEAGIARLLTVLEATEERLEGAV